MVFRYSFVSLMCLVFAVPDSANGALLTVKVKGTVVDAVNGFSPLLDLPLTVTFTLILDKPEAFPGDPSSAVYFHGLTNGFNLEVAGSQIAGYRRYDVFVDNNVASRDSLVITAGDFTVLPGQMRARFRDLTETVFSSDNLPRSFNISDFITGHAAGLTDVELINNSGDALRGEFFTTAGSLVNWDKVKLVPIGYNVSLVGFGSTSYLPFLSDELLIPTTFVEDAPEGFSVFGVDDIGQLVLGVPQGAVSDGELFADLFPGWTPAEVLADPNLFFDDAAVRAFVASQFPPMGSDVVSDIVAFDTLGVTTVVPSATITTGIPEPSSLTLAGLGSIALLAYHWRRRRRA